MGRVGQIKFIPTGSGGLGIADIPVEIQREVEEMYAALKVTDGRFQVAFDTEDELKDYVRQVESYCAQRPTDEVTFPAVLGEAVEGEEPEVIEPEITFKRTGQIRFRKSPARGLNKTTMQFRITDVQTEKEAANAAATQAVKDATEAVKAGAASVPAETATPKPQVPAKATARKR